MPDDGTRRQAAFPNDTNGDGDGPARIQTATSTDMCKRREGHLPETLMCTMKATAVSAANKGGSNKPKDTRL